MEAGVENKVTVKNFIRKMEFDGTFVDYPFQNEDWEIPTDKGGHSLSSCYERIERAITGYDSALLKDALGNIIGTEDFEILEISVTQIQSGKHQGIFKIDTSVRLNPDAGEIKDFPLVVAISRHKDFNDFVKTDHNKIIEMRKAEADELVLDEDDEESDGMMTIPKHYGAYEDADTFLYLAKYLEGYFEINIYDTGKPSFFGGADRRIRLNGMNLSSRSKFLEEIDSQSILLLIAIHQMETALRCNLILSPCLRAGDYLYSPARNNIMMHTYRDPHHSPNAFWALATEGFDSGLDRKTELVTYQLLQLIFSRENNLPSSPYGMAEYFIFNDFLILLTINQLMESLDFSKETWMGVLVLIDGWRGRLAREFEGDDSFKIYDERISKLREALVSQLFRFP